MIRIGRAKSGLVLAAAGHAAVKLAGLATVLVVGLFLLVHAMPGDPAVRISGPAATAQDIATTRHALGLDRPLVPQFFHYLADLSAMRLGDSYVTGEPVKQIVADRLPKTAALAGGAFLLVMLVSIPLGILAAVAVEKGRRRWVDVSFTFFASLVSAIPSFLAATFLAFLFAVLLGWLPVAGGEGWRAFVLPVLALALRPLGELARIVRIETRNVLHRDYIRTARSKRLPTRMILVRHLLPNVITGSLTLGGSLLAGLIGGSIIVENVFAWPGLGTALVQAVLSRDYPVIQAIALLLGVATILINSLVDLLLGFLDPRRSLA